MFKSFTAYKLAAPAQLISDTFANWEEHPFHPCSGGEAFSIGYSPVHEGAYGLRIGVDLLAHVTIERKTVPADLVRRLTDAAAANYERKVIPVLVAHGLLIVGSTSASETDAVVSHYVKTNSDWVVTQLVTENEPGAELTTWVREHLVPDLALNLGRNVSFEGDEGLAVFKDHSLDSEAVEAQKHKRVVELGLRFEDSLSFTLTDSLQFKSVKMLDLQPEGDDAFMAEATIWAAELQRCLAAVAGALGGEHVNE